jgi:hypothetical protein
VSEQLAAAAAAAACGSTCAAMHVDGTDVVGEWSWLLLLLLLLGFANTACAVARLLLVQTYRIGIVCTNF